MPQIISGGIGSGLDISGLVSQLVQAERAPVESRLNTNEIRAQSRLSAYGALKSALSNFQTALEKLQDAGLYQGRTASVSNSELFAVSAESDAAAGNYSVQAEKLASRHKLASDAFLSDDTEIGTGTLVFNMNGESFEVDVGAESDSLISIRDAVNAAPDNTGVTASVIRDQFGSRLVFTAAETGADHTISINVLTELGDSGDLAQLSYDPQAPPEDNGLTEKQEAADAELVIDGFTARSATNVFDEVLDGVSITLQAAEPGQLESLDVVLDKDALRTAIKSFVEAYNSLRGQINTLTAYNAETGDAGLLQGDSTTRRLASQLREALGDVVADADSDLDTLAEIGVSTNFENGKLEIDDDRLDELIDTRFGDFASLFSGESGMAARLDSVAEVYTRFEGILDNRSGGLESQIDRISDQREALAKRLEVIEARYLQQFNALDTLLGELNQTSSFLTSQLANLPGFTRDSD